MLFYFKRFLTKWCGFNSDPLMGTRWEEVLCSFFQFLIAISFLRASWGTVPSLCISRGFETGVIHTLMQRPFYFILLSFVLLTFPAFSASIAEGWMFWGSSSLLVCRFLLRSLKMSMQQCHRKQSKCAKGKLTCLLSKKPSKQKEPPMNNKISRRDVALSF